MWLHRPQKDFPDITLESSIAHLQSANLENDDLIRVVALLKSKI